MKKGFIFTFSLIAIATLSCKKDASEFQGQVRYIDSTGTYLAADSAIITFHPTDTFNAATFTTAADDIGIFLLGNIPDGVWVVKGELTIDSATTYVGVTPKLECLGQEMIAAPIDMIEI